ncbi:MAG: Rieske 2Fe-2S domain-containing protein, partial [Gammaproteobacteria bacterium]|nr:Rieske 2Fe-2S domain-containing protein [Gammaproteobacteria bacterium]
MENSNYQPGWYRFDLANKIKKGKIYSYHYFGKPLVCFRDKNNIVNIFDAHCPHLGAHLGVGGTIKNNRLICPFHGWQYDTQGK